MKGSWYLWDIQRAELTCWVYAQPGAKQQKVLGIYRDALKISVMARAVDGQANQAMARFLAQCCQVSPSCVALLSGATQRRKRFLVSRLQALPAVWHEWLSE